MNKRLKKDKKFRNEYSKVEKDYMLLKSFLGNDYIDKNVYDFSRLREILGGYRNKMVNYCLITGKSRGIIRGYRLFRLELLNSVKFGYIEGLKKISGK